MRTASRPAQRGPSGRHRLLGLVLTLAMAWSGLGRDASIMVCRFSGQIMSPSDCEQVEGAELPSDGTFDTQTCCEIRETHTRALPGETASTASLARLAWSPWLPPEPELPKADARHTEFVAARQQAPPPIPVYLSVRSLLI